MNTERKYSMIGLRLCNVEGCKKPTQHLNTCCPLHAKDHGGYVGDS